MAVAEVVDVGLDAWLGVALSSPLIDDSAELRDVIQRGLKEMETLLQVFKIQMIDLHCHLDLYPQPAAIVEECARRNMYA